MVDGADEEKNKSTVKKNEQGVEGRRNSTIGVAIKSVGEVGGERKRRKSQNIVKESRSCQRHSSLSIASFLLYVIHTLLQRRQQGSHKSPL